LIADGSSALLKGRLRRSALRELRSISEPQRQLAQDRIPALLDELLDQLRPRVVGAYIALPTELDLQAWLRRLAVRGIEVALPALEDGLPAMRIVGSLEHVETTRGLLSMREFERSNRVDPRHIELLLAPGLLFDRAGRRLGRGGGFYDRLLANRLAAGATFGVCFSPQIVDWLPSEAHDVCVSGCVTETRIERFQ